VPNPSPPGTPALDRAENRMTGWPGRSILADVMQQLLYG